MYLVFSQTHLSTPSVPSLLQYHLSKCTPMSNRLPKTIGKWLQYEPKHAL